MNEKQKDFYNEVYYAAMDAKEKGPRYKLYVGVEVYKRLKELDSAIPQHSTPLRYVVFGGPELVVDDTLEPDKMEVRT